MSVTIDDDRDGSTGETLLEALDNARIFSVKLEDDGLFCFEESCDCYFTAHLTKEQVITLADELRALAGATKDETDI